MGEALLVMAGLAAGGLIGYMVGRRAGTAGGEADVPYWEVVEEAVEEVPAEASPEEGHGGQQLADAEALETRCGELAREVEALRTDLRRYRRLAGAHVNDLSDSLATLWMRERLPMRVHDLEPLTGDQRDRLDGVAGALERDLAGVDVGTGEIHFQLGLWQAATGRHGEALASFQEAARQGHVPEALLAVGDCHWSLGRSKKAAESYARCFDGKRMPAHVFTRYAEVAAGERRHADALAALERVLSRARAPEEAFALASLAAGKLGDDDRALRICDEGLRKHEGSPLLRASMIIPLGRVGEHERAAEAAETARAADPELAEVPFFHGVERMHAGDDRRAAQLLGEALALQPDHAEALVCLGVIHNRRGEFKAALDLLDRAVEERPNYAEAFFHMKESYEGLRDYDNAIAVLNRAVQLNPEYE